MKSFKLLVILFFYICTISSVNAQWQSGTNVTKQVSTSDDVLIGGASRSGGGKKCFWDYGKRAFRGGELESFSTNWNLTNLGDYSFSFGYNTKSTGDNSVSFGYETEATSFAATAFGNWTNANGDHSSAFGSNTLASGNTSSAFGDHTIASGDYSTSFGFETEASGEGSIAFGNNTKASGVLSSAFGYNTEATNELSMVIGSGPFNGAYLINDIPKSLMIGFDSTVPTFFVGPSPSNSGTGNVSIGGDTSPVQKLEVNGAIEIGTTIINTNGTIRYNGSNFQGRHGGSWKNLDESATAPVWDESGNTAAYSGSVVIGSTSGSGAQQLDVDGAIKIGNTTTEKPGSIRYDGTNFQGYHNDEWKNLDEEASAAVWDESGSYAVYPGSVIIGSATGAQQLDVDGAIKIGNTTTDKVGSIRFNDTNFQGYNGNEWKNLDEDAGGSSVWNLNGSETYYDAGNVGIGTNNPNHLLHVAGDLAVTGTIIAPSDRRLKKEIQPITDALDLVSALQPKTYKYKEAQVVEHGLSKKQQYGLIAQELEEILPSLISQQAIVAEDGTTYKGVEYTQLIPILTQAMKELKEESDKVIDELQKENAALKNAIKSNAELVGKRLEALEQHVVEN